MPGALKERVKSPKFTVLKGHHQMVAPDSSALATRRVDFSNLSLSQQFTKGNEEA